MLWVFSQSCSAIANAQPVSISLNFGVVRGLYAGIVVMKNVLGSGNNNGRRDKLIKYSRNFDDSTNIRLQS